MAKQKPTTKGTLYTRGAKGVYYLLYYVNGKRFRKRLTYDDGKPITVERDAEKARLRILAPYLANEQKQLREQAVAALKSAEEVAQEAEDAAREGLRIADVWGRFPYTESSPKKSGRTRRKLTPKTVADNKALWDKFVAWMAEAHPEVPCVEGVTGEIAEEWSRHIRDTEGLSHNRHNKLIQTASVMFRATGRPDPFADIPRYTFVPESRENLERDELLKVVKAATGEMKRLYMVAIFSGMRLGDCATLEWDSVKLDHNRLIRRTAKTGKTVAFPLHPALREELERTPVDLRQGPVCPETAALYERDPSAISKRTRKLFENAGLTTQEAGEGRKRQISRRNFHSFRHSFITECARAGVPIGQIRDWIGHQSKQITEIYEHWSGNESHEKMLQALPDTRQLNEADKAESADRGQLAELARSLSIETVRKMLAVAEVAGQKLI